MPDCKLYVRLNYIRNTKTDTSLCDTRHFSRTQVNDEFFVNFLRRKRGACAKPFKFYV